MDKGLVGVVGEVTGGGEVRAGVDWVRLLWVTLLGLLRGLEVYELGLVAAAEVLRVRSVASFMVETICAPVEAIPAPWPS